MREISERYRCVAGTFGDRVREVPADAWDSPTPCPGWAARDVVRHLVDWVPSYFGGTWGLTAPPMPSVDDDPASAWDGLNTFLQSSLDDAALATSIRDTPMGTMSFEDAFAMIALSDVVIHTWDLARAVGLDETLDPAEVRGLLAAMKDLTPELRGDFFAPAVELGEGASDQDRMLAYSGRRP